MSDKSVSILGETTVLQSNVAVDAIPFMNDAHEDEVQLVLTNGNGAPVNL